MAIVFWLFLLFSPVLWIISFILLLVKRRPLTFLFNLLLCGVVIWLLWMGIGSDKQAVAATGDMLDDMGNTAISIVEGITKGFLAMVVAAGWGVSILIYSMLCSAATKPELELLSDRINDRMRSASPAGPASSPVGPPVTRSAKRSNTVAYILVGGIILYLLAKKAAEMGL